MVGCGKFLNPINDLYIGHKKKPKKKLKKTPVQQISGMHEEEGRLGKNATHIKKTGEDSPGNYFTCS